jgi:hypothetical protein
MSDLVSAELVRYSGFLTHRPLADPELDAARVAADRFGGVADVTREWTEIEYSGRDSGRRVVQLLQQLATILRDADGEVLCEIDQEETTPAFAFYWIRGGKLLRQPGRVVRGPVEEVAPLTSGTTSGDVERREPQPA